VAKAIVRHGENLHIVLSSWEGSNSRLIVVFANVWSTGTSTLGPPSKETENVKWRSDGAWFSRNDMPVHRLASLRINSLPGLG